MKKANEGARLALASTLRQVADEIEADAASGAVHPSIEAVLLVNRFETNGVTFSGAYAIHGWTSTAISGYLADSLKVLAQLPDDANEAVRDQLTRFLVDYAAKKKREEQDRKSGLN